MAETAKKISMIPAKVQYDRNVKLSEKKMKVAAYCRVSTELEEQDSSYEAQLEYYTSKISENENWKNAGIYADVGKSGTNTTATFFSFSFRMVTSESTVFLANLLTDFVRIMSIFPARASCIMALKSALFLVFVPLFPSSA